MRLYLPESWLGDPERLDKAGVPEGERRPLTKGQIALELLDRVRGEGLPGGLVVADAGYGVSGPFRDGLAERGLHYIVGVTDEMVVFTEEPRWVEPTAATGGRPRKRHRLAEDSPRPVSLKELAGADAAAEGDLARGDQGADVRAGSPGCGSGRAGGWATGRVRRGRADLAADRGAGRRQDQVRLQQPAGGHQPDRAVRLWRSRWPVEQGYQQMKEELGLDHFEGRSWRGFHHHACLVMLAYGFLALEQTSSPPGAIPAGQKGGRRAPVITLPAIRRALQRLLAPISRHDCPYCRPWLAHGKTKLTE